MTIDLTINGESTTLEARDGEDLASALRRAGHKEVKCGCDGGDCGASAVLVDGESKMACGMEAAEAEGASIRTVQGLGTQDDLHPIQQAFVDHFAVQCGFCVPGMVIEAQALLSENPDPSEREVREAIDDVVCRCTGYQKPVEAILDAADRVGDEQSVATDGGSQRDVTDSSSRPDVTDGSSQPDATDGDSRPDSTSAVASTTAPDCDTCTGDPNE